MYCPILSPMTCSVQRIHMCPALRRRQATRWSTLVCSLLDQRYCTPSQPQKLETTRTCIPGMPPITLCPMTAPLSPSHLVLTADSLIILRELSDRAGWGRVKHRHILSTILKITAKKKHPDIITFKFGTGSGAEAVVTHQLRFRIPNTHKFTSAIRSQLQALNLRPGS